ncbi:MAG: ATP synthase F1 subunit delta [Candidatus Omnitrophica bacterium]|nr:ATP synthase F1 subunit delta [Candidatus Omnitrophota bacterium]
MRDRIIVKRYAQAYVDFASPKIGVELCVEEMKSLRWLLREEKQFVHFLIAPEISRPEKARVLDNVLKENYSDATIVFINYLIVRHRVYLLTAICDQVRTQFAHGDLVDVTLRTTFPLELEIIGRVKAKLEEVFAIHSNLYLELDPDLLGGVQVVVGNRIIDGSVRNRLLQLKKQLLKAQVI